MSIGTGTTHNTQHVTTAEKNTDRCTSMHFLQRPYLGRRGSHSHQAVHTIHENGIHLIIWGSSLFLVNFVCDKFAHRKRMRIINYTSIVISSE